MDRTMNTVERTSAYVAQNGTARLTAPQQRRLAKKSHKESDPTAGKHSRLRKREESRQLRRRQRESTAVVRYIRALRNGWRKDEAA